MSANRVESAVGAVEWPDLLDGLRSCLRDRLAGSDRRYSLPSNQPRALARLANRFGLSPFEAAVLALCAATEWDAEIAALCMRLQGTTERGGPTYSFSVEALEGGSWSALAPVGKLRRWRLADLNPGPSIAAARFSADERVLQHLLGVSYLDVRLEGLVLPVTAADPIATPLSERLAAIWEQAEDIATCPVIELPPQASQEPARVAHKVCSALGLALHRIDAHAIPAGFAEREALARLWEREALLENSALLVDGGSLDPVEVAARVVPFLDSLQGVAFYLGVLPQLRRAQLRVDDGPADGAPSAEEWRRRLGPLAAQLNGELEPLRAQFRLRPAALDRAIERAVHAPPGAVADTLWDACRVEARADLESLAQRIDVRAGWKDLVLPEAQLQTLRTVALHVRQRHKVYDNWGFAEKSARGLGIGALFTGGSGTGKTLAAEVLAAELRLDLYRIDLASMVSKYIGETEKNLRRVFDVAEAGGAILLFDEADALFGSRSEVRDSHDRYANLEVAYLLQRVESYRGLVVLTTNLKQAIDPAFLRRIRFIVHFPIPDAPARRDIWDRAFPDQTPRDGIDLDRLARLNLTGGHIRNIALNAAFLAADRAEPVRMRHLLSATEAEYAKLERPLPRGDVGDWL